MMNAKNLIQIASCDIRIPHDETIALIETIDVNDLHEVERNLAGLIEQTKRLQEYLGNRIRRDIYGSGVAE
jgi:hypothetical protein